MAHRTGSTVTMMGRVRSGYVNGSLPKAWGGVIPQTIVPNTPILPNDGKAQRVAALICTNDDSAGPFTKEWRIQGTVQATNYMRVVLNEGEGMVLPGFTTHSDGLGFRLAVTGVSVNTGAFEWVL